MKQVKTKSTKSTKQSQTALPTVPLAQPALQSKAILKPGLYLIRLLQRDAFEGFHEVKLSAGSSLQSQGKLTFFQGCGVSRQALREAGQCIVLRVDDAPAEIEMTYAVDSQEVLAHYVIKIDRVDDSGRMPDTAQQAASTQAAGSKAAGPVTKKALAIGLKGQIAEAGGVEVNAGEWLGQEEGTQAIELVTVVSGLLPDGLEILTTAEVYPVGALPQMKTNQPSGLPGYGLPLTGVSFKLDGPNAARYELHAQAAFGGWGVVSGEPGAEVRLVGPTGKEPLVGLRLAVVG